MRNCVICTKAFDEEKADHVPGRPPKELWTCSKVCQARLDKRAGAAQELQRAKVEDAEAEETEEEAGPSEAERARAALDALNAPEAPPAAADLFEYARAARHLISAAEELSAPEDRAIVLTLAQGFLGRAIVDAPELGDEEGEDPPAAARPVGRARSSDGATEHVVSRDGAGVLSCTCPGFKFRKTCRHVDEAKRFPGRFQ